jgi:hypothetical protein
MVWTIALLNGENNYKSKKNRNTMRCVGSWQWYINTHGGLIKQLKNLLQITVNTFSTHLHRRFGNLCSWTDSSQENKSNNRVTQQRREQCFSLLHASVSILMSSGLWSCVICICIYICVCVCVCVCVSTQVERLVDRLILYIMPKWVGSTWRRRQNRLRNVVF